MRAATVANQEQHDGDVSLPQGVADALEVLDGRAFVLRSEEHEVPRWRGLGIRERCDMHDRPGGVSEALDLGKSTLA